VPEVREGILAVEMFDARTRQCIWRGWVRKELTWIDLRYSARPIRQALATVLGDFPPQIEL
jgi:hypothetical protein